MLTLAVLTVAALAQTTTTTIPKIVGEPLDTWVVVTAGFALFVAVVVGGLALRRRGREPQP